MVSSLLVLRLIHGAESMTVMTNVQWLEARQLGEHWLFRALAGAVGTNTEEALDLVADNGPFGGVNRSFVATEVVVFKELVFITRLAHGEHWVNQEDR